MTSEAEGRPLKLIFRRLAWAAAILFLCPALLFCPASARDKTAHITLQKVQPHEEIFSYQVKPGDRLLAIIKKKLGHIPRDMRLIREMNPHIQDINRIYPGQTIALPQASPEKSEIKDENTYYVVARGDSLSSILKRKLNLAGADLKRALRLTKEINPALKDTNKIYPGQKILLPVAKAAPPVLVAEPCSKGICEAQEPATVGLQQPQTIEILETILERMNAKLINVGSYHLPLAGIANFAIDNSIIPQIEFADGSVTFLDFNRRIPEDIKESIARNWPSITVVHLDYALTITQILEKIFSPKRSYLLQKLEQPLMIGSPAQVDIQADLLIGWPGTNEASAGRQAIIFVKDPSHLLPRAIRLFAEKTGLIVTEVLSGRVTPRDKPLSGDIAPVPAITGNSTIELIRDFLAIAGLRATEAAEVSLFEPVKEGFKLSFTADLLVTVQGRPVIFHGRPLPPPFISRLGEMGYQVVIIGAQETRSDALQKSFTALQLPFSSAMFSFSLPGKPEGQINRVNFPALKVTLGRKENFLIGFDLDLYLHAYLANHWRLKLLRY